MISLSSITNRAAFLALSSVLLLAAINLSTLAQHVAILTPNGTALDDSVAANTRTALSASFRTQDLAMSATALEASGKRSNAFNLTTDEARDLAAVLGCDFFIVIRTGTLRRASIEQADHSESFAAFFVVSGRTGRLLKWRLVSEIGLDAAGSEQRLMRSLAPTDFVEPITAAWKTELLEQASSGFEPMPEVGTPESKDFRAPVPYRRLKPEYTRTAYLYEVTATVEATVDLDENGVVKNVAITRWAGYGLDESVIKTIGSMNWRPAERNGKTSPARYLLRYNFRKIEKDNDNE